MATRHTSGRAVLTRRNLGLEAPMTDPRIFQGSPLTEVPLEWVRARCDDDRIDRERATEVAPGVLVQVMAWGGMLMPDGKVTSGAQVAVWAPGPDRLSAARFEAQGLAQELTNALTGHGPSEVDRDLWAAGEQLTGLLERARDVLEKVARGS